MRLHTLPLVVDYSHYWSNVAYLNTSYKFINDSEERTTSIFRRENKVKHQAIETAAKLLSISLLSACFLLIASLTQEPEERGIVFLRNINKFLPDNLAQNRRK
jgi:hypothetical protein